MKAILNTCLFYQRICYNGRKSLLNTKGENISIMDRNRIIKAVEKYQYELLQDDGFDLFVDVETNIISKIKLYHSCFIPHKEDGKIICAIRNSRFSAFWVLTTKKMIYKKCILSQYVINHQSQNKNIGNNVAYYYDPEICEIELDRINYFFTVLNPPRKLYIGYSLEQVFEVYDTTVNVSILKNILEEIMDFEQEAGIYYRKGHDYYSLYTKLGDYLFFHLDKSHKEKLLLSLSEYSSECLSESDFLTILNRLFNELIFFRDEFVFYEVLNRFLKKIVKLVKKNAKELPEKKILNALKTLENDYTKIISKNDLDGLYNYYSIYLRNVMFLCENHPCIQTSEQYGKDHCWKAFFDYMVLAFDSKYSEKYLKERFCSFSSRCPIRIHFPKGEHMENKIKLDKRLLGKDDADTYIYIILAVLYENILQDQECWKKIL